MRIATLLDTHIGQQVRLRRLALGLSQRQLARSLGVKYQQVQKYEKGTSRPDAARLALLGRALKVGVDWLISSPGPSALKASDEAVDIDRRQHLSLLRAWRRITRTESRRSLLQLVEVIADESDAAS